jgi:hypothetical protein
MRKKTRCITLVLKKTRTGWSITVRITFSE